MESEVSISTPLPFHSHCQTCIKIMKCSVKPRPGESCAIVSCELECGVRFHACKKTEHHLLCPNEKVACINSVSGCPVQLLRKFLGSHLEICPASVVHCTMEWNRWPVHVFDRQPTQQPYQLFNETQLDVALALRDQRMLQQLWHAPRRVRRTLRNSLTEKYPPVPLNVLPCRGPFEPESRDTNTPLLEDIDDAPWELRKSPPGLESSVCGQLYRASRQTTESLTAALSMINNSVHVQGTYSGDWVVKDMCAVEKCSLDEEDKENVNLNIQHCKCQRKEGSFHEVAGFSEDHMSGKCNDECSKCTSCPTLQTKCHCVANPCDVLFVSNAIVSEISSSASTTKPLGRCPLPTCDSSFHPCPLAPPPPPFVTLGLDLNLESITRYQVKPKSMYTFLCAQEFRRDEYAWHYRNVHSDIHGGLNGWLEQRCPLAQYGCVFSRKRFHPVPIGSKIVHSNILESFGIQPPFPSHLGASCCRTSKKQAKRFPSLFRGNSMDIVHSSESFDDSQFPHEVSSSIASLTQLPFEVLQHIARYLDGFSLCNLSLTCRILRDVCCSLLDERGIVVLHWEQRKVNGKHSWQVAYKRWFFSTAFTPVREWRFSDDSNMSNHLQVCKFFNRNIKMDPYFFPLGAEPNTYLYEKLRNSCNRVAEVDPANITKL